MAGEQLRKWPPGRDISRKFARFPNRAPTRQTIQTGMQQHTILLVDDEAGILDIYREVVEEEGHTVLTAGNGREALDMLAAQPVDLVVSDIRMPVLDGHAMLDEMRRRGMDADVIFLTGYATVDSAVQCLSRGASDYLEKPFNVFKFRDKVHAVLNKRQQRRAQLDAPDALGLVHNLREAIAAHSDFKSIVRELLSHTRKVFDPDGLALYLVGSKGAAPRPKVVWGEAFRGGCDWFEAAAPHLFTSDDPALFSPGELTAHVPDCPSAVSVMCAPVAMGRGGYLVVMRSRESRAYTSANLSLLALFAMHGTSAFETLRVGRKMQEMNLEIITSHVASVEAKDIYTKGHSERVGQYAVLLGRQMGLPERELELLRFAGILHDVGKIGIPDEILNKAGRLTEDEFARMRQHPAMGRDIVSKISSFKELVPIIYHHHERVDGAGYPDGLTGASIPFLARLISVVDGFEAMTSDRSYQKARSVEDTVSILRGNAGTQWDAAIVDAWCDVVHKEFLFLPN